MTIRLCRRSAARLIFKHGYLRRKEELEDAEAALEQFADASER